VLSSHWLGLILSRASFSSRVDQAKAVAVERSAALSALAVLVLVVSGSPSLALIGPFVVGMCMALVMPTSLALAGERIRGNPGALFGVLLTVAQVGGIVLPASIGLVAEQTSVRLGLSLLVVSFAAITLNVRRVMRNGSSRLLYGSLVLRLSAQARDENRARFQWKRRCRRDQHKRAVG